LATTISFQPGRFFHLPPGGIAASRKRSLAAMKTYSVIRGCIATAAAAVVVSMVLAAAGGASAASPTPTPTPRPVKITVEDFSLAGAATGFATPVSAGCPSGDVCYAFTNGSAVGSPTGSATFTAMIDAVAPPTIANNGSDGTCTQATGSMTVKFGGNGSISMSFAGTLCDVGALPVSPNVGPLVMDAGFVIIGGTGGAFGLLNGNAGRGSGGSGTGRLTFSSDAAGNTLLWLSGIITFSQP
jgi:hypothetical protein